MRSRILPLYSAPEKAFFIKGLSTDNPPLLMIDMRCASMGERRFVAVNMRLFADLGGETPVYTVIAGSFTD
jgi:hypothetical protein